MTAAAEYVQVRGGSRYGLTDAHSGLLSRPASKAGRLQRACLSILLDHRDGGGLPTSVRFVFYELEGVGVIGKKYVDAAGRERARKPANDVADALMHLREVGLVPWDWIVDERRTVRSWPYAATVADYVTEAAAEARLDVWDGNPPPLILAESSSLAGVLTNLAARYLVDIAATNGQCGGFLVTDIAPLLVDGRRVLYLGDYDLAGGQIEDNTRRRLDEFAPGNGIIWERLALTAEQVASRNLPTITKNDARYTNGRPHEAVETEALGQAAIQELVNSRLDELLPEPLDNVQERERAQRDRVAASLAALACGWSQ